MDLKGCPSKKSTKKKTNESLKNGSEELSLEKKDQKKTNESLKNGSEELSLEEKDQKKTNESLLNLEEENSQTTKNRRPEFPKKPWQFYLEHKKSTYIQQHPEISYFDVTKLLRQKYERLQPEKLKRWTESARMDKERFQREKKLYKKLREDKRQANKKRRRESNDDENIFWNINHLEFIANFPLKNRQNQKEAESEERPSKRFKSEVMPVSLSDR